MGGWFSSLLGGATVEPEGWNEPDPATGLTPRNRHEVVQSWALVQPEMKPTGVALLIALFKAYPEHQNRFSAFADISLDELAKSKKFAAHASSVIHAVASLVDSLDDTECLVELLTKIGKSHAKHKIPPKAFDDLKEVLLKLLKEKLGGKLTPVAEESWDKTLTVANSVICQHLGQSEEKEKRSETTEQKEATSTTTSEKAAIEEKAAPESS